VGRPERTTAGDPVPRGTAFDGKPTFTGDPRRRTWGQRLVDNAPTDNENELYIDRDIMVLANPRSRAARVGHRARRRRRPGRRAVSTAAGLLLVVSTRHQPRPAEEDLHAEHLREERAAGRPHRGRRAVCVAGYFGINPPGFVAQVVAFAFGLAAATFFPAIILGIFVNRRANREGVVSGMLVGIVFTMAYIIYFKFMGGTPDQWLFGISPRASAPSACS
jgi:cation/acetate symporter